MHRCPRKFFGSISQYWINLISVNHHAACKILGREQASTHRHPHQCQCCTKAGSFSVMWASKPNVWLFSWFFTNHALVILAPAIWIYGSSPTSHQTYHLTRRRHLQAFASFDPDRCTQFYGKFDLFLYWIFEQCEWLVIISFWCHCFPCVIAVRQLLSGSTTYV